MLIFANVIRCSRLRFTPVFFYLTFLMDVFNSVKGINRTVSKGMSNIYSKVTIEKTENVDFLSLKIYN